MSVGKRATLESVASHARVSRQTVSNALNAPDLVRPATLDRVLAAIDELGYRPSRAARQLRTRRSQVLGFALPPSREGVVYAVGDQFIHALTEAAQRRGYRVMLFTAADDSQEIAQYEDLLLGADIDGFVLTNTHHGDPRTYWLLQRHVPFVTFGRPWGNGRPGERHAWVDVDGAAGTAHAVDRLLATGHDRIAYLGWPRGSGVGDDRRSGWERAMAGIGTPAADLATWAAETEDEIAVAADATRRLVETARPTALVCVSDTVALGALSVLRTLELPVAVVGFDDTPVAAAVGLTSLAQPIAAAAGTALELLLRRIDQPGEPSAPEQVLLTPVLVERASTGVLPIPHP